MLHQARGHTCEILGDEFSFLTRGKIFPKCEELAEKRRKRSRPVASTHEEHSEYDSNNILFSHAPKSHVNSLLELKQGKLSFLGLSQGKPFPRHDVNKRKRVRRTELETIPEEYIPCSYDNNSLQSLVFETDIIAHRAVHPRAQETHGTTTNCFGISKRTLVSHKVSVSSWSSSSNNLVKQRKRKVCIKSACAGNKRNKFSQETRRLTTEKRENSLNRLHKRRSKEKHRGQRRQAQKALRKLLYKHFNVAPIESEQQLLCFFKKTNRLALLPSVMSSLTRRLFETVSTAKHTYGGNTKAYARSLFALLHVCASTCASLKTLYLLQLRAGSKSTTTAKAIDKQTNRKHNRDLHEEVRSALSQIERKMMKAFQNLERRPLKPLSVPSMKLR